MDCMMQGDPSEGNLAMLLEQEGPGCQIAWRFHPERSREPWGGDIDALAELKGHTCRGVVL